MTACSAPHTSAKSSPAICRFILPHAATAHTARLMQHGGPAVYRRDATAARLHHTPPSCPPPLLPTLSHLLKRSFGRHRLVLGSWRHPAPATIPSGGIYHLSYSLFTTLPNTTLTFDFKHVYARPSNTCPLTHLTLLQPDTTTPPTTIPSALLRPFYYFLYRLLCSTLPHVADSGLQQTVFAVVRRHTTCLPPPLLRITIWRTTSGTLFSARNSG